MTIGLYDIDFLHNSKFSINLELMTFYSYLLSQKQQVVFLRPQDDFGRCDSIYFFQEKLDSKVPLNLRISGKNRIINGYAFFKNYTPVCLEAQNSIPSFLPYELNSNLIKDQAVFTNIKNNSLIRLETNKGYFTKDSKKIYIADHEPLQDQFLDFFEQDKKFKFLYPVYINDLSTLFKIEKNLPKMIDVPKVACDFDSKTYKIFAPYQIKWIVQPKPYEKNLNLYYERIINMILWSKSRGYRTFLTVPTPTLEQRQKYPIGEFAMELVRWGRFANNKTFIETLPAAEAKKLQNAVEKTNLRLLIKQKPIKSIELDF